MNLEGSDKHKSANFNNYFNGIIVKAENFSDDLFMSLDISNAKVVLGMIIIFITLMEQMMCLMI